MNNSLDTDRKAMLVCMLAVSGRLCCRTGVAADLQTNSQGSGREGQTAADSAFPGFQIEKGFRLELVAAEPLVTAPVAMAFDENGRLFVAEMPGAAEGSSAQPQLGRIRMLQDTNGDGVFGTSTVYVDNLPEPSAIAWSDGGLYVGTMPDLIYLKKTGTNDSTEERSVIYSGLAGTNRTPGLARLNNLNWGLDNRFHGVTAAAGGGLPAARTAGTSVAAVAGTEITLDPRAHTLSTRGVPTFSGLSFDNWGGKFLNQPSHPLLTYMYRPRYAVRNPFFVAPRELFDVASPATQVFSASGQAWLTNAHGGAIYRGSAFPPSYLGNAFVADPQAHVIHRFVLREDGLAPMATRPAEERTMEFLASTDATFRPLQVINGPDGALYIADQQDDRGRGRIYRIVPLNFKRPKPPQLGKASTYDLVAMLSHPNGWQRDTAARLLYERQDPAGVALSVKVLDASPIPLARLHALYALEGLGALKQEVLIRALRDRDARLREHAVLLSERRVEDGVMPDSVWSQLLAMTADPSLRVRWQLAFTLGDVRAPERVQALAALVLRDSGNTWLQAAVLSSVTEGAGDLFTALARNTQFRNDQAGLAFLRRLAAMIGVAGRTGDAGQVVDFINQTALGQDAATALLSSLGEGLYYGGSAYLKTDPTGRIQRLFTSAFAIAANPYASDAIRTDALRLVGAGPDMFADARSWLLAVFGSNQRPAVQSAAIAAIGRFYDPQIAPVVIQNWPAFTPALRREAVIALLARPYRVGDTMAALQDGRIGQADVPSAQKNYLRTYPDEAIRQSALRLFGPVPVQRPEAVQRFTPALDLKGTPDRGRDIFAARCTACHWQATQGPAPGPDLVAARVGGKRSILAAMLEPNTEVRPTGAACIAQITGGEVLIGVLLDENPATITMGQPNAVQVVLPRANLLSFLAQSWSFMPIGLEEGLSLQDMADLLEYVVTMPR